jgi:hypothetical protein
MIARPIRSFAFVTLVGLLALGATNAAVAADHLRPAFGPASPTLTDDSALAPARGVFTVAGQHFTPGGHVYLALYDQMGAKLYETRWVNATVASSYPLGIDPAGERGHEQHPFPGGTVQASFGNLCGATAMLRALDQTTDTWSNWLTVEPACVAYVEPRSGPR